MPNYVSLKDILDKNGKNIKYATDTETDFIYGMLDKPTVALDGTLEKPSTSTGNHKIYQFQGNDNTGTIKFLGTAEKRPTILLQKFKLDKYDCQLVSYVLSEEDLMEINDKPFIRLLGIVIKNGSKIVGALNLVFYTFVHKIDKSDILNYVNKEITGIYAIDYHYMNESKLETIRIKTLDKFLGKTKSIYQLAELLSDEKIKLF